MGKVCHTEGGVSWSLLSPTEVSGLNGFSPLRSSRILKRTLGLFDKAQKSTAGRRGPSGEAVG